MTCRTTFLAAAAALLLGLAALPPAPAGAQGVLGSARPESGARPEGRPRPGGDRIVIERPGTGRIELRRDRRHWGRTVIPVPGYWGPDRRDRVVVVPAPAPPPEAPPAPEPDPMPLAQPHRQRVGAAAPPDAALAVTLEAHGDSVDAVARALGEKRDRVASALVASATGACIARQGGVGIAPAAADAAAPEGAFAGTLELELRVPGAGDPLAVIAALPQGIVAGVREIDETASPAPDARILRRPEGLAGGCETGGAVTRRAPGS